MRGQSSMWLLLMSVCSWNLLAHGTYDLNKHQIQLVADHLNEEECHKLFSWTKDMKEENKDADTDFGHPLGVQDDPDEPCLDLLGRWDKKTGMGSSFDDLVARLSTLGHNDLANRLSSSVYHEKAQSVKEAFLDDPFKAMVDRESPLLDQPVEEDVNSLTSSNSSYERRGWTWCHTLSLVGLCVSTVVLVWICCHTHCPTLWSITPCADCEQTCAQHFHTHLLGVPAPKPRAEPLLSHSQMLHIPEKAIMDMQKHPSRHTEANDVDTTSFQRL